MIFDQNKGNLYVGRIALIKQNDLKVVVDGIHDGIAEEDLEYLPNTMILAGFSAPVDSGISVPYNLGSFVLIMFLNNDIRTPVLVGSIINQYERFINNPAPNNDKLAVQYRGSGIEVDNTGNLNIHSKQFNRINFKDGNQEIKTKSKIEIIDDSYDLKVADIIAIQSTQFLLNLGRMGIDASEVAVNSQGNLALMGNSVITGATGSVGISAGGSVNIIGGTNPTTGQFPNSAIVLSSALTGLIEIKNITGTLGETVENLFTLIEYNLDFYKEIIAVMEALTVPTGVGPSGTPINLPIAKPLLEGKLTVQKAVLKLLLAKMKLLLK